MHTLPKGFQLLETCAPSAKAAEQAKSLSRVVDEMLASFFSVTETRAASREALSSAAFSLRQAAVEEYTKQLESPSDSMDDLVMMLLEKAHSLQSSRNF